MNMWYNGHMEEQVLNENLMERLESFIRNELGIKIIQGFQRFQSGSNSKADYLMKMKLGQYEIRVLTEVKGHVSNLQQVKKFVGLATEFQGMGILVAEFIDVKIKEHLKKNGIGYFDLSEDIFIPLNFKLEEDDRDNVKLLHGYYIKNKGFKAESNIKLLLYFLSKPEALSYTQRHLSENLDMSLGAINKALSNLDKVKLILSKGSKRYFGKFDELVNRWRISYLDFEEKNLLLGKFSPINDDFYMDWKKKDLKGISSYWGGEPAASIRTDYLSPEVYRIYTYNDQVLPLLKELRLKKDPNGKVEIFRAFWPNEVNNLDGTVPDFLTYCDLHNSGIDRNIETAKVLEEKIKKELEKYVY
jgi:hypothetical protein